MTKRTVFLMVGLIFIYAAMALGEDIKSGEDIATIDSQITAEEVFQNKFNQLKKMETSGKWEEIRNQYDSALKDSSLTAKQRMQVQAAYELLNYELIFSSKESPETIIHTIVRGDNLYDIARKYGTTIELIKRVNKLESDTIYPDKKLKIIQGVFTIDVDKSENQLVLNLNGKPVRRYSVATGKDNNTPTGEFKIVTKLIDPTWYKAGAVVPPGSPENTLGTRWLGFDKAGYGIHGTTEPETIGTQASAGCIRMHNMEVEELYAIVPSGTRVNVVN